MKNKVENIENQYTSQENKKKQRQKMKMRVVRRRITVFAGVLLAIIVVLSILLVVQKHRNDIDAQERKAKEAQFQKQQNEEIALKEKLNNLNDKDYIEKIARDDYYLSNKGEVIFRLPEDKDSSSSKSSKK
ncbi:cell-division initiation protein [Staphylococcus aureus]|uniref:cell division protein DivIC n=1 Tax=Staphylococcus aureus TaxID=1280 RepID=UPI00091CCA83|nr:septum formation initiator family protein [Staphylococcus aureus]SGU96504.1 cell-division initiation protein [Staphylococcus aureus]